MNLCCDAFFRDRPQATLSDAFDRYSRPGGLTKDAGQKHLQILLANLEERALLMATTPHV